MPAPDFNSLPEMQETNLVQQIGVTDNISRIFGAHQIKFGLDYRYAEGFLQTRLRLRRSHGTYDRVDVPGRHARS